MNPIIKLIIGLCILLPSVMAIPFPLGVDGTVYYNDQTTPVRQGTVIISGESFVAQGPLRSDGSFAAALKGTPGDTYSIFVQTPYGNTSQQLIIYEVVHDVAMYINATPPPLAIISQPPAAKEDIFWEYDIISNKDYLQLEYEIIQAPSWVSLSDNTLTGIFSFPGIYPIMVKITDPLTNINVVHAFNLDVIEQNDAPQIMSYPVTQVSQGTFFTYSIQAVDEENDTLTFEVQGPPSVKATNNTVWWLPQQVGNFSINIEVSDGINSAYQSFNLEVVPFINTPPRIVSRPPITAPAHILFTYAIQVEDDQEITVDLQQGPPGATIHQGQLEWDATPGEHAFIIAATDSFGATTRQQFTIKFISTNTPPEFTSVPPTITAPLKHYTYNANAYDADGDTLSFSLLKAPRGMRISKTTGSVFWIPRSKGLYDVVIGVSDGVYQVNQSYTLDAGQKTAKDFPLFFKPFVVAGQIKMADGEDAQKMIYAITNTNTGETITGNIEDIGYYADVMYGNEGDQIDVTVGTNHYNETFAQQLTGNAMQHQMTVTNNSLLLRKGKIFVQNLLIGMVMGVLLLIMVGLRWKQ